MTRRSATRRPVPPSALLLCAALTLGGRGPAAAASPPWPTLQQNAAHTGYVPATLDVPRVAFLWEHTFGTLALNPVAADEGRVFVSEYGFFNTPRLYARAAPSGEPLWEAEFGPIHATGAPSVVAGTVYLATNNHNRDSYLWAFAADSGAERFSSPIAAQWDHYGAPTVFGGMVYAQGGYYGGLYAFDAESGSERWFSGLANYDEWSPAVDEAFVYAYLGDDEEGAGLFVLRRQGGTLAAALVDLGFEWTGWSMETSPLLGAAGAVFVVQGGRLLRFDVTAGRLDWQLAAGFTGQPAYAGGVLYVVADGALHAREAVGGALLWEWRPPAGDALDSHVLVTDAEVVAASANVTYIVDLQTATNVAAFPAGGQLALAEDRLFIAGARGRLVVLSAPSCGPSGDVDGDGERSVADAEAAFGIALGAVVPTAAEAVRADCNGDGRVTAGDAQAIWAAVFGAGACAAAR